MVELPERKYIQHPTAGCRGPFFLTLCCQGRAHRFGEVRGEAMCLNRAGQVAEEEAKALSGKIRGLVVVALQVMPDHVHLLLGFDADTDCAIGDVVKMFKGAVDLRIRRWYDAQGLKMGKLWQRGYYEHIIRDNNDFENTVHYIADNPRRWAANHNDLPIAEPIDHPSTTPIDSPTVDDNANTHGPQGIVHYSLFIIHYV